MADRSTEPEKAAKRAVDEPSARTTLPESIARRYGGARSARQQERTRAATRRRAAALPARVPSWSATDRRGPAASPRRRNRRSHRGRAGLRPYLQTRLHQAPPMTPEERSRTSRARWTTSPTRPSTRPRRTFSGISLRSVAGWPKHADQAARRTRRCDAPRGRSSGDYSMRVNVNEWQIARLLGGCNGRKLDDCLARNIAELNALTETALAKYAAEAADLRYAEHVEHVLGQLDGLVARQGVAQSRFAWSVGASGTSRQVQRRWAGRRSR